MAKGLTLDIGANTREVVRGAKDTADALEDVSDSLDDLARGGPKAGDKLEDSFKGTIKQSEKTERSFKDLADTAQRETKKAGSDIGRNMKDGTDKAKEGVDEVGREAASTAKESAASFDGSAASIGDAFQEVAANAFAGFGPAGLIAGVAAAAGIGVVFSAIQKGAENTEKFKERVGELADEFIETGEIGAASVEFISDKLKEMATSTEDGVDNLKDLRELADQARTPFDDLAQAVAGNTDELDKLVKAGEKHYDQLADQASAVNTLDSANNGLYGKLMKQAQAQDRINDKLRESQKAAAAAEQAEADYAASGGPALQAKAALIATIDEAYDDAAGATDDYINAESGLFDTGAYIAAMQAKEKALADYQETLATSPLTPAAKSFLDSQGAESAATFLAGYKSATPAQQVELRRIWDAAGKTSSGSYTASLKAGIPATLPGPLVKITVDEADARRQFNNLVRNPLSVNVVPRLIARPGLRVD